MRFGQREEGLEVVRGECRRGIDIAGLLDRGFDTELSGAPAVRPYYDDGEEGEGVVQRDDCGLPLENLRTDDLEPGRLDVLDYARDGGHVGAMCEPQFPEAGEEFVEG